MPMISSGLAANCSGLVYPTRPKASFQNQRNLINSYPSLPPVTKRIVRGSSQSLGVICAASQGNNYNQLSYDDDYTTEPFWLTLIKEIYSDWKALFAFLAEQPGQLKYIEWPGFRSTLKTATLTLVLVALLIVALSSVDSALSYILASVLRKTP